MSQALRLFYELHLKENTSLFFICFQQHMNGFCFQWEANTVSTLQKGITINTVLTNNVTVLNINNIALGTAIWNYSLAKSGVNPTFQNMILPNPDNPTKFGYSVQPLKFWGSVQHIKFWDSVSKSEVLGSVSNSGNRHSLSNSGSSGSQILGLILAFRILSFWQCLKFLAFWWQPFEFWDSEQHAKFLF